MTELPKVRVFHATFGEGFTSDPLDAEKLRVEFPARNETRTILAGYLKTADGVNLRPQWVRTHPAVIVRKLVGKPQPVIRQPNNPNNRVTVCWSCGNRLESATGEKCRSCGWIACYCGACGCNRPKPVIANSDPDDIPF